MSVQHLIRADSVQLLLIPVWLVHASHSRSNMKHWPRGWPKRDDCETDQARRSLRSIGASQARTVDEQKQTTTENHRYSSEISAMSMIQAYLPSSTRPCFTREDVGHSTCSSEMAEIAGLLRYSKREKQLFKVVWHKAQATCCKLTFKVIWIWGATQ